MLSFIFLLVFLLSYITQAETVDTDTCSGDDLITQVEMRYQDLYIKIRTDSYNGANITYTGTLGSIDVDAPVFWGEKDDLLICDTKAYFCYLVYEHGFRLLDHRSDPVKMYFRQAVENEDPFFYAYGSMNVLKRSREGRLELQSQGCEERVFYVHWPKFPEETVESYAAFVSHNRQAHEAKQLHNSHTSSCAEVFFREDYIYYVFIGGGVILFLVWRTKEGERQREEERKKKQAKQAKINAKKQEELRRQSEIQRKKWEEEQIEERRQERVRRDNLIVQSRYEGVDICLKCGKYNPPRCPRYNCYSCMECGSTDSVFNVRELANRAGYQCHWCDQQDN